MTMRYVDITGAPTTNNRPTILSREQRHRLLHSPIHRRIKHYAHTVLALGLVGGVVNVVGLVLAAVWAKRILQEDRWFIFHYVLSSTFSLLWAVYSFILARDVKRMAWPDELQIDIGWFCVRGLLLHFAKKLTFRRFSCYQFADIFLASFLLYLYRKMRTYGVLSMFDVAWSVFLSFPFHS
jgi:hypothetical protein